MHAPPLSEPVALPMPTATESIEQAKDDRSKYGFCILAGAMSESLLRRCQQKFDRQRAAGARVRGGWPAVRAREECDG
eukprot:SAG11_NODE_4931_length_1719_cov_1.133333_2_plen_78_part_00